jgi:putative transposase
MAQQGRNFSMVAEDWKLPCRYLVHDRDNSFGALDHLLKADRLIILKTPPHAPLCNAYAERHVREIRETLDQLVLLGESHLCRTLASIQDHHNAQRPHQGLGNLIPLEFDYPAQPASPLEVQCHERLGGLLNHYSIQQAA